MKPGSEIQIEEGNWSKVHNAIFEALATAPLNGSEFRCLMFLFRQTYGFHKKEDTISLQQFGDATALTRRNAYRALEGLIDKHVIYQKDNGSNRPKTYGFNKYTEQWFSETVVESDNSSDDETVLSSDNSSDSTVVESDNKTVVESDTHKRKKEKAASLPSSEPPESSHEDDAFALVQLAYGKCNEYPPRNVNNSNHEIFGLASKLIEIYGFQVCEEKTEVLYQRNIKMVQSGKRKGIQAPIQYLATLLDDMAPQPNGASGTVDLNVEEYGI